jgi:hypothetical protein
MLNAHWLLSHRREYAAADASAFYIHTYVTPNPVFKLFWIFFVVVVLECV